MQPHACFVHPILLFPLHSLLKGFRLSHACFVHSISLFPLHSLLKGFRLSHACHSLVPRLVWARDYACHAHSVLFQPMQRSLTIFWRSFTGLVQLILGFPSWFHTIWFYCSHTFHSFSRKLHSAFRLDQKTWSQRSRFPSYRYSSFTLRAYLCRRHTYCQRPIIELAKNVSPKNKMAASHVVQIHTHARFPRSKNWLTYHVAVPTGNALASQRSIFRENRLKFSTFIRR